MKDFLLKFPIIYRTYQKTVRIKKNEYLFFQYLFKNIQSKKLRVLDLCCGDSFILKFINEYIEDYLGVDNNILYFKKNLTKWKKYKFLNEDLNNLTLNKEIINFNPNLIFMNGAIHHLNDRLVKTISGIIVNNFEKSLFISLDPVILNNKTINKFMIKLDRGKFIRETDSYKKILKCFENFVIDDFYRMSFKNIFHYRNINIKEYYYDWKKLY